MTLIKMKSAHASEKRKKATDKGPWAKEWMWQKKWKDKMKKKKREVGFREKEIGLRGWEISNSTQSWEGVTSSPLKVRAFGCCSTFLSLWRGMGRWILLGLCSIGSLINTSVRLQWDLHLLSSNTWWKSAAELSAQCHFVKNSFIGGGFWTNTHKKTYMFLLLH